MNIFSSFFIGSKKSVSRLLFFRWCVIDGRWIAFIKRFVFQDFKVVPAVLGTIAGVATALVVTGCCWWFLFAAAKRPDSREKKRRVSPSELHNVTHSSHQRHTQGDININPTQEDLNKNHTPDDLNVNHKPDQDLHLTAWYYSHWCHRQNNCYIAQCDRMNNRQIAYSCRMNKY